MALSSHFFIESGAITTQSSAQGFGPVNNTTFNITSRFTLAADQKAYSICKGVVLVQPQGSSDKVNLILRPYTQPFPGLSIKYFIYRGLKKADFFNSDAEKKIIAANGSATSDFINKIRSNYADYYTSIGVAVADHPPFLAKFIGYNENVTEVPLNTPISDFFFKESLMVEATPGVYTEEENKDFELPMIDGGKSLGSFATGDCGIDVVLNYGDYKHEFNNEEFVFDLNYARAAFSQIILASGDTDIQKKLKREQSNQFVDIAAFYGLFVGDGEVKCFTGGSQVTKTGVAIYNDLLGGFVTKNKWYLYIQSDRSRSYNFYDNYKLAPTNANCLKMGNVATTLTEANYKTQDWPMLILDMPVVANTTNKCSKFLQFVTDNNVNTVLYGQVGVITNAPKDNFCNADFLRQVPDTNGVYSNLTQVLELSQNALPNGTLIAGLTLLHYHGVTYKYKAGTAVDENNVTVDVMATPNFFDDVFGLIHSKPLMQLNASTEFSKMTETKAQLINHYFDRKQQGISAVQTLVVNDVIETGDEITPLVDRVTYITEAQNVMSNITSPTSGIPNDSKNSASAGGAVSQNKTYSLSEPYYYSLQSFTDSGQIINGMLLKSSDGKLPAKIVLGITQVENDLLKVIINTHNTLSDKLLNPRLFLMDLFEDGSELVSTENIKYQKYKIGLVGEDEDGLLKLFYPTTDVIVYSLDRLYHFSMNYSKYIKEEVTNELTMDLDISL